MVYTKHFHIHTMNKLQQSKDYIENAEKTVVNDKANHFNNLFPYVTKADKTMSQQLVSGHLITDVFNAATEMLLTKELAMKSRGTHLTLDLDSGQLVFDKALLEQATVNGKSVLAHHFIQSFDSSDNLTPEEIHEIGRQTMLEWTGGEYEFIIATHTDKAHIHNHIIMNHINAKTGKAIRLPKNPKLPFEEVSDKIASKYGAKIIDPSPKNSHKRYTQWQAEAIFKNKIKQRLDFLLDHASSLEDLSSKALALNLKIDFSGKWTTYQLLDHDQEKKTRSRALDKRQNISAEDCQYNLQAIQKRVEANAGTFSIDEVVEQYQEIETSYKNDFDLQVIIEPWQVSHSTTKGYYLNVDFGADKRGQIFINARQVDQLADGNYALYLKKDHLFKFLDQANGQNSKRIKGTTLARQLSLYNGRVPLEKDPSIAKLEDVVASLNFLARHEVTDGRQFEQLEGRLQSALDEAQNKLDELDHKIETYRQAIKAALVDNLTDDTPTHDIEEMQAHMDAVMQSRQLIHDELVNKQDEIKAFYALRARAGRGGKKEV